VRCLRRGADPSPACLLGGVQSPVRPFQELFEHGVGILAQGYARRDAHFEGCRERKGGNLVNQLLARFGDAPFLLAVKEDDELVTSEPQGEPVLTCAGCDYSGDLFQDGVAGEVTVDVVDEFEVVDVDEYRAPGLTGSGRGEG
jgi:hypothetical protein